MDSVEHQCLHQTQCGGTEKSLYQIEGHGFFFNGSKVFKVFKVLKVFKDFPQIISASFPAASHGRLP